MELEERIRELEIDGRVATSGFGEEHIETRDWRLRL